MIKLFYWAYGKYWYSTTVSANHSRTENIYFSSLKEMIEWGNKLWILKRRGGKYDRRKEKRRYIKTV